MIVVATACGAVGGFLISVVLFFLGFAFFFGTRQAFWRHAAIGVAISAVIWILFDQIMGAALGAVKAFVLVEILLILFVTYPRFDLDTRIRDSEFASKMLHAAPPMLKVLPGVFDSKVNQFNGD